MGSNGKKKPLSERGRYKSQMCAPDFGRRENGILNMSILSVTPTTLPEVTPVSHPLQKTLILKDKNIHGGFAQVPNVVLRDPRLSSNAVRLYCLLLTHAWGKDECFPGQETLAGYMGCDRRTVIRTLHELNEHCLITWKRQGLGKVNIYYIERLSDGYLPEYPNQVR